MTAHCDITRYTLMTGQWQLRVPIRKLLGTAQEWPKFLNSEDHRVALQVGSILHLSCRSTATKMASWLRYHEQSCCLKTRGLVQLEHATAPMGCLEIHRFRRSACLWRAFTSSLRSVVCQRQQVGLLRSGSNA